MTGPQPPYGGPGGQWHGAGDWQAPSDQTQYGGPPGYEQPPQYDQYGYEQPQQYDQFQQPGYSDQYSAPPAGYQEPYSAPPGYPDPHAAPAVPLPPPPKPSNPAPVILGILAGVVVLVLLVIVGGWLAFRDPGNATADGGGDSGGSGSGYSAEGVRNACDLVDPSALKKWARDQKEEPEHNENRSDYSTTLNCSARYSTEGDSYASASLYMSAAVSEHAKKSYESYEETAKGRTGTGKESGDVSGLGDDAYFAKEVDESEYSTSVSYQLGVLDDNLMFTIRVAVFGDESVDVSEEDVAKLCEEQAKKLMEGLRG